MTEGDIAQKGQFLLWLESFQLFSVIIPSFPEIYHNFFLDVFKEVCCRYVDVGKGKTTWQPINHIRTDPTVFIWILNLPTPMADA